MRAGALICGADQRFARGEPSPQGNRDRMARHLLIFKASLRRMQAATPKRPPGAAGSVDLPVGRGGRRAVEALALGFRLRRHGDLDLGVRLLQNARALAERVGDAQLNSSVPHLAHLLCAAGRAPRRRRSSAAIASLREAGSPIIRCASSG